MNNFKKLLASAMALSMVASVLPASTHVHAANAVTNTVDASGWESNGASVRFDRDGNAYIGTEPGGALNRENNSRITANGTTISAHVGLEGYEAGELFVLDVVLEDLSAQYASEFYATTTKTDNGYVISTGFGPETIDVKENGIYTYNWTFKKDEENNLSAVFTVENYDELVGTIEVENVTTYGDVESIRYMWAFGRGADPSSYALDRELVIYDTLPSKDDEEEVDTGVCDLNTLKVDDYAEAILMDLENAGKDLETVQLGDRINWHNLNSLLEEGKDAGATFNSMLNEMNGIFDARVNNCTGSREASDDVKYIAGFKEGLADMDDLFDDLAAAVKAEEIKDEKDWKANYEDLYNRLLANEKYLGNTTWNKNRVSRFEDNADAFKDMVAVYKDEFYDVYAEEYVESLKKEFAKELELDKNDKYQGRSLAALTKKLEEVQASDEYTLYGEEADVVEIIDAVENVIADLETVDELLDSSSDVNKAYRSVRSDVNRLANKNDEAALDVIDKYFSAEDIEAVQAYVEEVVSEFYTYETRERSSGRYYVRETATDLAAYIDNNDIDENVRAILTTILDADQKSEDTVYDVLVDTDVTVVTKEDLIAIVEEAEGVELKWTYTTGEIDLVDNAMDALEKLLAKDSKYELNARERRSLEAEQDRLERISNRVKNAEAEIIVTKDWWVFENGQWVFYQDGRTVSNVWVADHNNDWYYAGANGVMLTNSWIARDSSLQVWYYVGADGKMVTNTVVDGCTIDANGEWHA